MAFQVKTKQKTFLNNNFQTTESKKEEFRKYLEKAGVID